MNFQMSNDITFFPWPGAFRESCFHGDYNANERHLMFKGSRCVQTI